MGQRVMRSKWEYSCGDSNHSIGWMRKGDSLTLDKLFTLTLLSSTMWPELGVSYNWGLISLIITSPNSDGGWQLYPPSHPQLIIKLKKWKSTLIKESTCQLSSCSNRLMNFQTLKTHSPSMVETLTQPPTLRYSEDERINQFFQLNQTVIHLIYILLKLKIIIES